MESGTHLSNINEAEALAMVSEKRIAKGGRRVTAFTMHTECQAIHQILVFSAQIDDANKMQGAALKKVGVTTLLLWVNRSLLFSATLCLCPGMERNFKIGLTSGELQLLLIQCSR